MVSCRHRRVHTESTQLYADLRERQRRVHLWMPTWLRPRYWRPQLQK